MTSITIYTKHTMLCITVLQEIKSLAHLNLSDVDDAQLRVRRCSSYNRQPNTVTAHYHTASYLGEFEF